jgi:hypothetical protein
MAGALWRYSTQEEGCTDHSFIQVTVPAHELVCWLFLGNWKDTKTKPETQGEAEAEAEAGTSPDTGTGTDKQVVCHNDVCSISKAMWRPKLDSLKVPGNGLWFPMAGRCLSHACVSPLCLHWGTQSSNARSGSRKAQLWCRRARMKLVD